MSVMWVVSSGSYSDYRVEFACESEAAATDLAARMDLLEGAEVYYVESFPVLTEAPSRELVLNLCATMNPAGAVVSRQEWTYPYWTHREVVPPVTVTREPALESGVRCVNIVVRGSDHEWVRKTLGEQVAMYVAQATDTDEQDASTFADLAEGRRVVVNTRTGATRAVPTTDSEAWS